MADRMESASGGARRGRTTTTEPEALAVSTIATAAVHRAREHPDRFPQPALNAVGIARRARCRADQLAIIRDRLKRIQPGIWPGGRR
jgi:hypothetical protein